MNFIMFFVLSLIPFFVSLISFMLFFLIHGTLFSKANFFLFFTFLINQISISQIITILFLNSAIISFFALQRCYNVRFSYFCVIFSQFFFLQFSFNSCYKIFLTHKIIKFHLKFIFYCYYGIINTRTRIYFM